MMQTIRISDAVRCLLLNVPKEPNLVCPKGSLFGTRPLGNTTLWRETLVHRQDRITLVSWDGMHLSGLASAQTRAGHRVWEVDRLYVPTEPARSRANGHRRFQPLDSVFLGLLEDLVRVAGHRRAERILVRLPSRSPAVLLTRRAGFFPHFEESLLEGRVGRSLPNGATPSVPLQRRLPEDDYALFQLFCATTPQQVRAGLGLTFDQWRDAQEPRPRGGREWVTRNNGRITGWLGLWSHGGVEEGNVMPHPGYPDALQPLVDPALALQGLHRWLVPDYQEMVKASLLRHGFHETARYTVLIKTVAAPVLRHGMAAVEA